MLVAFPPSSTEFVKGFQLLVSHLHEQGKRRGLIKQGLLSHRSLPGLKIGFCAWKMYDEVVTLKWTSAVLFSSWLLLIVVEKLNYTGAGGEGGTTMDRLSSQLPDKIKQLLEELPNEDWSYEKCQRETLPSPFPISRRLCNAGVGRERPWESGSGSAGSSSSSRGALRGWGEPWKSSHILNDLPRLPLSKHEEISYKHRSWSGDFFSSCLFKNQPLSFLNLNSDQASY